MNTGERLGGACYGQKQKHMEAWRCAAASLSAAAAMGFVSYVQLMYSRSAAGTVMRSGGRGHCVGCAAMAGAFGCRCAGRGF
jgi:hypothetical protein